MLHKYSNLDENAPMLALKSLFQKYDVNDDGSLNKDELYALMENEFGLTVDQINAYHWVLDKNGDGRLSFEEFKCWMVSDERFRCVDDTSRFMLMISAIELFEKYDTDKNRTLDRSEFKLLFLDCGGKIENLSVALSFLDKDKNGVISFYEFLKWLNWVDIGNM